MSAGTIPIKQGTDASITVTFKNADASPFNLTGCTVELRVKRNANDPIALIDKVVTSHTNPTGGVTAIPVTNTDSNVPVRGYLYSLKLTDSTGAKRASSVGTFSIEPVV